MNVLARSLSAVRKAFTPASLAWSPSWAYSAGRAYEDKSAPAIASLAAVNGSLRHLAGGIMSSKARLVRDLPTGGVETLTDARISPILRRMQALEGILHDYYLSGDGFAVLRDGRFVHIERKRCQLERKHGTRDVYLRIEPEYTDAESVEHIPPGDYFQLRHTPSTSSVYGQSPLDRSAPGLAFAARVIQAADAVMQNSPNPGGLIIAPGGMRPEARDRLREDLAKTFTGMRAGKMAFFDQDVRLERVPTPEAMISEALTSLARFGVAEVSRAMGVPLSLLSETGTVNRSTSSEESRSFSLFTISPLAKRIAQTLTDFLLSDEEIDRGIRIDLDVSDAMLGWGSERADFVSKLINGGAISRNEGRNILGYGDVDNGEEIAAPVNTSPLSVWIDGPTPAANNAPDVPDPTRNYIPPSAPLAQTEQAQVIDFRSQLAEGRLRMSVAGQAFASHCEKITQTGIVYK